LIVDSRHAWRCGLDLSAGAALREAYAAWVVDATFALIMGGDMCASFTMGTLTLSVMNIAAAYAWSDPKPFRRGVLIRFSGAPTVMFLFSCLPCLFCYYTLPYGGHPNISYPGLPLLSVCMQTPPLLISMTFPSRLNSDPVNTVQDLSQWAGSSTAPPLAHLCAVVQSSSVHWQRNVFSWRTLTKAFGTD